MYITKTPNEDFPLPISSVLEDSTENCRSESDLKFFRVCFLKVILQVGALVLRIKKGRNIFQKFRLIFATHFIESNMIKTDVS